MSPTIAIQLMGTVVAALALVARSIICSSTGSGSSGRRCRCEEIKEEYKQSEGDHIKGRIRQLDMPA
jgi:flagellar biosynthetic protein FlhB